MKENFIDDLILRKLITITVKNPPIKPAKGTAIASDGLAVRGTPIENNALITTIEK